MAKFKLFYASLFFITLIQTSGCRQDVKNIERPEKIVSKRQVIYDKDTYSKLADLWESYYDEFPSEDSYANWMYASRYAERADYESLLQKGLNKYPAHPTLLYLTALLKHGAKDNLEAIHLLEKAAKLDPSYLDPWFALTVDYMGSGDIEKTDVALRKLLEEHAISDEIMDYNYNVITLLDKNAILITNGDNDTYPGWILTRIVKYRPDVRIVNRSLLNTEWYTIHLMKNEGIPNFITNENLKKLGDDYAARIREHKQAKEPIESFSDILLTYLINSAQTNKRPVYLAATLYSSKTIDDYKENGLNLGLVTQILPSDIGYQTQIKNIIDKWLNDFRTGGLESWQLKYAKETSAGKWLVTNYGEALKSLMSAITRYIPERRLDLFHWYKNYLIDLLPIEKIDDINSSWCQSKDIKEINNWCKSKNYVK